MTGRDSGEAWGALHDPQRVGADRHDDSRGWSVGLRSMKDVFAVERRVRHMVRPRSAFLGLRAQGVSR